MKNKWSGVLAFILCLFTFQSPAQKITTLNFTENDGLPSNTIRTIFKDSRGLLWIGTDNGLCSYDGLKFKVYDEIVNLKNNSVWSIVEDLQHNI